MSRSATLAGAVAALCLLVLEAGATAEFEYPLDVVVTRLRFRSRGDPAVARDSAVLKASLETWQLPPRFDPAVDRLEVEIAGKDILALPPVGDRARLTGKRGVRYRYSERRSPDRVGVRRLVLDLRRGRLVFKANRLDLTEIYHQEGTEVPVAAGFGNVTLTANPILTDKGGKWVIRSLQGFRGKQFPSLWPGGWGVETEGDPLEFRVFFADGRTDMTVSAHAILRDAASYAEFWNTHIGPFLPETGGSPPSPPPVDFDTDIVVGIFLGPFFNDTATTEIYTVRAQGDGARIRYEELAPQVSPPFGPIYPYILATIARVPGPVTFASNLKIVE
jgi:hypothetical protein